MPAGYWCRPNAVPKAACWNIDRDLLLIPNVAIHMNRQVNDGYKWNPVTDVLPLPASPENKGQLTAMLEKGAGGKILSHDLFLYVRQKASVWGLDESFLSSAALDDLECVWGCFRGFLASGAGPFHPSLRRPGQRGGWLLLPPGRRPHSAEPDRLPDCPGSCPG